jgi:hypothetical protein
MMKILPTIRLALLIMLTSLASMTGSGNTSHSFTMVTDSSVQSEQIAEINRNLERLEKHIEYQDTVIDGLKDDQHTWKGIVVGIGSVIGILEFLQALGFARSRYTEKKT